MTADSRRKKCCIIFYPDDVEPMAAFMEEAKRGISDSVIDVPDPQLSGSVYLVPDTGGDPVQCRKYTDSGGGDNLRY